MAVCNMVFILRMEAAQPGQGTQTGTKHGQQAERPDAKPSKVSAGTERKKKKSPNHNPANPVPTNSTKAHTHN